MKDEEKQPSLKSQEVKSIERLYEQVRDYDLVLTVDAPLADAINTRLEQPKLGLFATTPRRWALNKMDSDEIIENDRDLFLNIVNHLDIDWKRTAHILENILDCWKETGDPDNILREEMFDDQETKSVLKVIQSTVNPYTALERHTLPESKKVAVIAFHQFNALDKKILPDDHDVISPFLERKDEQPHFDIFNSSAEMVETVLSSVKRLEPEDVGVVVEKGSQYNYLIQAGLRSNDIPYMLSRDITENEALRNFMNLIRLAFFKRGIKIGEVKSFVEDEQKIDPKISEYFLRSSIDPALIGIKKKLDELPEMTFQEILKDDIFENELEELENQLEKLGLLDKKITLRLLNSLSYYLNTFDVPSESTDRGVLIASPKTSAYIDRSVIFYIGMDTSWTPESSARPWVDKDKFDHKKRNDFKILLQNGQQRYFLVQDRVMDQNVTPSFYFNEFTEEEIESFRDLKHELRKKELISEERAFSKEHIEVDEHRKEMMSQTALNALSYCPKDQFFSELIDTSDKPYFRKGTLFHDFAEYYVNHPEVEEELEEVVQKMIEHMSPFIEEYERIGLRTQFLIGVKNLIAFLKNSEPGLKEPKGYVKKYTENIFAEHFGEEINTKFTESSFYNKKVGAKGKVDLILDKDHIVDHKSGRKKSIYQIIRDSDIEDIGRKPDFQAKMYIAHHRHHHPDTPITFTFYHLLENSDEVVTGEDSPEQNELEIKYHPRKFDHIFQKEKIFESLKSSKNRKKVLDKLGYNRYRNFFEDRSLPEVDKQEIKNKDITTEFINFAQSKIGSYKYVKKACKSIMRELVKYRKNHLFKDDIDDFETFLQEQIKKYDEYRRSNFPVGDVDLDKIENKDLVIVDE